MSDGLSPALDARQIRASFDRAAASYDAVAVLQREVGQRLLERLDLVRLEPRQVLDLGCGTGVGTLALQRRYRKARVLALDLAPAMLAATRRRAPWYRRPACVCADAERLPLADASVDLIHSNLTFQWCTDLRRLFSECRRVLRPGGLLTFTTLGPDTLNELRAAWAAVDARPHVNSFLDLHDVGDAMARSGLEGVVLDVDRYTLTYDDALGLMRDLKALGAHNVAVGRARGLTGRRGLARMQAAYEARRRDGRLPATYEVVFGHAWGSEAAVGGQAADGSATFPLSALRRRR